MRTPTSSPRLSALVLGALGALSGVAHAASKPPVAPVRPVTDTFFGTEVVDNYRYLENLKDPEVQAWMKAQADYTRGTLDGLSGRAQLLERIHALSNSDVRRGGFSRRGERYFYEVFEPGSQLPKLCYRDGLKGDEHVLVDPAALGQGTSTHYALDFYMPSWDGARVAYGVSSGGSEASVLHLIEVATGKVLEEAIDRTNHCVVGWRSDNKSFFYLRYNKPTANTPASEMLFNARAYLHTIGTHVDGEGDEVVFGRGVAKNLDVPEGQATYVITSDSPWVIGVANHNMDGNPATVFAAPLAKVKGAATPWVKIATVDDEVVGTDSGDLLLHGDRLTFLSLKGAPRGQVLSISLAKPDLKHPQIVVPQGQAVITDLSLAKEGLYVRERDGAVSKLLRVGVDGKGSHPVPVPFEGNLFRAITDPHASGALFNMQSWIQAPRLIEYDPAKDASADTGLLPPSKIDTSRLETREVLATSYDGTQIPLSLIYQKGLKLDGSHPAIVDGYGSYGISIESHYLPTALAWAEHGGVLALGHLRGGGEKGEDWHAAGKMLTKTNTIEDFIACGQYLVDQHYTTSKRLAGHGVSAGGISVGGALTWRPDLFAVILDEVGISDALRAETAANGPPNIPEFGSTKTEPGFHGLYAMAALEHVHDGVAYPATMFVTGANDPRVPSWHMTKMAARVQAATASDRPVLLRIDYDAGHGAGSTVSQRERLTADMWSFALWQMGDPAFRPTTR